MLDDKIANPILGPHDLLVSLFWILSLFAKRKKWWALNPDEKNIYSCVAYLINLKQKKVENRNQLLLSIHWKRMDKDKTKALKI